MHTDLKTRYLLKLSPVLRFNRTSRIINKDPYKNKERSDSESNPLKTGEAIWRVITQETSHDLTESLYILQMLSLRFFFQIAEQSTAAHQPYGESWGLTTMSLLIRSFSSKTSKKLPKIQFLKQVWLQCISRNSFLILSILSMSALLFHSLIRGHWNRFPREVVTATILSELKKHLDDTLSHMV